MTVPLDVRAIETLIFRYAQRIDVGDFAGVAELFRHGRIEAAPGFVVEGAAAVQRLYENSTRRYEDGTPRTHHVITNIIVDLATSTDSIPADPADPTSPDPDKSRADASATSYYTVFQQTETVPLQAIIAGRYQDTFKVVDEQWCFDTRQILVDLTGDLSGHLLIDLD